MCGIAGFVGVEPSPAEPREALVRRMCAAIRHRGPDDEGVHVDGYAAIGMRRLSIIDVATGHQPMTDEDGRIVVVFNGEIYNFRELAAELRERGPPVSNDERHRGDRPRVGAVGRGRSQPPARDVRHRGLGHRSRDAVAGARPAGHQAAALRSGRRPSRLRFGDQVAACRPRGAASDRSGRRSTTTARSCTRRRDRSIFAGIRKLPPGHVLRWRDGHARTGGTGTCRTSSFQGTEQEAAAAAQGTAPRRGPLAHGQRRAARGLPLRRRRLERRGRTDGRSLTAAREDLLDRLRGGGLRRAALRARGGASASAPSTTSSSSGPTRCRSSTGSSPTSTSRSATRRPSPRGTSRRSRARHVKVVLSGDGGDELFGGYARYRPHARVEAFDRLHIPGRQAAAKLAWRHWPRGLRGRNFLRHVSLDAEGRYLEDIGFFRPDEKRVLYTPSFARAVAGSDPFAAMGRTLGAEPHLSWPSRMMRFDFRTYLPNDVLTKVDRMSMAHSIESQGAPARHRHRRVRGDAPLFVHDHPRRPAEAPPQAGRGRPVAGVDPRSLQAGVRRTDRRRGSGATCGICSPTRCSRRARASAATSSRDRSGASSTEHIAGRRDHTLRLWLLVVLELWQRQYVDAGTWTEAAA